MNYEQQPPVNPSFIRILFLQADGSQTDGLYSAQMSAYGFWEHRLMKTPKREFAGTSGPPSYWSTNPNTGTVVDYFGPNGLGYIPQIPSHLN